MSESTNRRSVLAKTVKHPVKWFSKVSWCLVCWVVLVFAHLPAIVFAQSSYSGMQVKILNIKNSTGVVACALVESSAGFPIEIVAIQIHTTFQSFYKVKTQLIGVLDFPQKCLLGSSKSRDYFLV